MSQIFVCVESGERLSIELSEEDLCGQEVWMDEDGDGFTVTSLLHLNGTFWGLLRETRWADEFDYTVLPSTLPEKIFPRGGTFSPISKEEAIEWLLAHELPLPPALRETCEVKSLREYLQERAAGAESAPVSSVAPGQGESRTEAPPPEESGGDATRDSHPTVFKEGNWDLTDPGEAAYKGGPPFTLSGVNRKLLACLIKAKGRAVRYGRLKEACGNDEMETPTLTGYISRLKEHLREHLAAQQLQGPPISHADPQAYRLNWL
jgi:hypothetical protein